MMKKYWKLTTLTIFIVAVIGALYIQTSLAKNSFPEFVIKHQSGDKAEVKPLKVIGNYRANEMNYIYTEISDQGTSYRNYESSYLYLLKEDYLQSEMKHLIKNYRSFMRGKQDEQIYSFFEDQNILTFAGLKSEYIYTHHGRWTYSLVVDVLDKKTNKNTAFELAIPEDEKYNYINIQGVQLINDELKIITTNEPLSNNEYYAQEEIHIYTVDLDTQKIVEDLEISSTAADLESNQWHSIYGVHRGADIGPNNYFVFQEEKKEEIMLDEGYYDHQTIARQYIVYHFETGEQESIHLPDEYGIELNPELLNGSTIYFSRETDNEIEIIGYDLESKQIELEQTFVLSHAEDNLFSQFHIMNDKIYIVQQPNEGVIDSAIMIGNIQTGEILYEGSIELATSDKNQQVEKMHINEMRVNKE